MQERYMETRESFNQQAEREKADKDTYVLER